ncbi:MAG: Phage SPO1 DNA polymerase-related protein [Candidatus Woesebacteria bacterium GW2011_GWB1_39_12]|uniref:Type-4 uracil-DNA glycosylase n=2 Tax=Candidatus Woeseibacteriota TaxID=1752722 RepID=A0A0G0PHY0_9BACT|nr:MAG: Phage SPO1 DNA polymerase-related protein [Candidatus Woesebacteria bacterium GW2011_GWA1_39_12]KKR00656.1 MAG: Phage SPO1 DNA polymerase-related protein [Candidatus Woesebacteria bacterium GW2011_GWB1_39_12]
MNKQEQLNKLKVQMREDKNLPLRKGATQLVFGVGDPETEIVFIGEGPGYYEDQKGEPFVGNAGAFLNQLLSSAGLTRQEVFITNVVHHRPPQNRDPEPDEIKAYGLYLDQMIDIISPKIIVTLGRFSMGKFLPSARITGVHGKKFDVNWEGEDLVVVPMYHPAAGLRNPSVKEQTVEDFKKLPGILEEIKNKESSKKEEVEQMQLV